MKKLSIAALALLAVSAQAQIKEVWHQNFLDATFASRTLETAVTPNGHTLSLSILENKALRLNRYDGAGGQVWTQTYYNGADLNLPIFMRTDADGAAIFAYTNIAGKAYAMKVGPLGNILWFKALVDLTIVKGMEVDPQGNVVVLGNPAGMNGGTGPVVYKFGSNGNLVGEKVSIHNGLVATALAVADNGQIYFTAFENGEMDNYAYALTPNLTIRYSSMWSAFGLAYPAADRNGRFATVERLGTSQILIQAFTSTGTRRSFTCTLQAESKKIIPDFDANGRLVVGAQVRTNASFDTLSLDYFSVTDAATNFLTRVQVHDGGTSMALTGLYTDAFGQTYLTSQKSYFDTWGSMDAIDEQHASPIWTVDDNSALGFNGDVRGSVGRWGQAAFGTTLGASRLYEGITGIRQRGLRNLTINGQSFTGGRTITGTVNFYSNDTVDRTVNLTSSTAFAGIAPTLNVPTGASQATMSIDLEPTSVRRAVAIEGEFNGTKRKAVFYIEPPVAASLTLFPTSTKGGKVVNATGRLNGIAPTAGITATLSSDRAAAPVPASLTFSSGQISKGFTIQTTPVSMTQTATITMTAGSVAKSAVLTITP